MFKERGKDFIKTTVWTLVINEETRKKLGLAIEETS
jgi:hypothetical protein